MNVEQIIEQVKNEVDDTVSESAMATWIYDAMVEIATQYGKVTQWEIEAEKSVLVDLPSDYLITANVLDSDKREYSDYTITEYGQIMFPIDGTFTVTYHRVPEALPDAGSPGFKTAIPEVHSIFHSAIALWCKAEYWDKESDSDQIESGFSDKFRGRFYQKVMTGASTLKGRAFRRRVIESAKW